jgi:hypothetical protein
MTASPFAVNDKVKVPDGIGEADGEIMTVCRSGALEVLVTREWKFSGGVMKRESYEAMFYPGTDAYNKIRLA